MATTHDKQLPRQEHPFILAGDDALVLLVDDTDDRPKDKQSALDGRHYYQWHTILFPKKIMSSFVGDWKTIKNKYDIPGCCLHCHQHSRILLSKDIKIHKDIIDLFMGYDAKQLITRSYDGEAQRALSAICTEELCAKLKKDWNVTSTKAMALYLHLVHMDGYLMRHLPKQQGFVFCDRTERSDTKFKNKTTLGDGWGQYGHHHLHQIHQQICFRIKKFPVDDLGYLLDLVDYMAWSHQRVLRLISARDFGTGGQDLTEEVFQQRIEKIRSEADKQLCHNFKTLFASEKLKYLFRKDYPQDMLNAQDCGGL